MNRGKKTGWWSNPSYTIEDAISRSNLTQRQWDAMDWYEKAKRIAFLRASDTIEAWNNVSDEDKKKWQMQVLSELVSKP